jgi:NIMA (never in mitosis gene a)-related kinase
MEYCEGGDLQQIIRRCRKQNDHIAEDVIWKILTQITLGLYQCHRRQEAQKINNSLTSSEGASQKILHRDLKPGNIFLDQNSNVKIGDFGLARVMNTESQFAYTHVGTPYYMSPEQINEQKYNEQSDIWSLGCIIYEMAALHPPFTAQNHLSLAMKIKAGKYERIP